MIYYGAMQVAIIWALGLAPALAVRYLIAGEPLPLGKAAGISALTVAILAALLLFLNSFVYGVGTNVVALGLVFLVGLWIMSRGPAASDADEADKIARRNRLIEGLEAIAADPDAAPEERQKAIEKLREFGEKPPG